MRAEIWIIGDKKPGLKPRLKAKVASLFDKIAKKCTQIHKPRVSLKDMFTFRHARRPKAHKPKASCSTAQISKREYCTICLEYTHADQIFLITDCQHKYCFSCMSKHVKFKVFQGIFTPKCPHHNCNSELKLEICKTFLSPELFDLICERVKESSIPLADRIYCPYPKCSTFLSKNELQLSMEKSQVVSKCPKCSGLFCINCKVPWEWHKDMSCFEFEKKSNSDADYKVKCLATQNKWRQCPKCNHMVSLESGCYHIYCRCRHEFCYTCGAEWKNKKATCKCPVWDEQNRRPAI